MENPRPIQQDIADAILASVDAMDAEVTTDPTPEQLRDTLKEELQKVFPDQDVEVKIIDEGKVGKVSKVQDAANQCKDCGDPNCPGRTLIALGTLSKEQEAAISMVMEMATNRIKRQQNLLNEASQLIARRDGKIGELGRSLADEKAQNAELVDAVARLQKDNKRLIKVTLALAKK